MVDGGEVLDKQEGLRGDGITLPADQFDGLAVNPQTGETVHVKAQKLCVYNSDHTRLEAEGLVFDEPTMWPAADSLTGLAVCDMCRYYTRGEDASYCIYKPNTPLKLCEPHNAPCQHYEHAAEMPRPGQPNPEQTDKHKKNGYEDDDWRGREEATTARAMEILRTGDPVDYIMGVYHRMHVGDDNHGRLLLVSIGCQLAANTRGIHPAATGESGDGKTDADQAMIHLQPREYVLVASVTDKVLYYKGMRPGTVIFLDDIQNMSEGLQEMIKQATSFYQEGYTHWTLDKNRNPVCTRIPPRCAWWVTSVGNDFQDQLLNRQMILTVENREDHKRLIMRHQLAMAKTGMPDRPEDVEVWTCRQMIRILKNQPLVNVVIPYADRIVWNNWENPRNLPMFLDTIRAFAMLNRFQRGGDANGNIVASLEDYEEAKRLWSTISRSQVSKLTNREIACLQALRDLGGEADINQLATRMKRARNTIVEILNGAKGRGGLCGKIVLKREDLVETRHGEKCSTSTHRTVYYLPENIDVLGNYTELVDLLPESGAANPAEQSTGSSGVAAEPPANIKNTITPPTAEANCNSVSTPAPLAPSSQAERVRRVFDIIRDLSRDSVRMGGPRGAPENGILSYMATYGEKPEDTRALLEKLLEQGVLMRLPNAPYYYQVVT